jgi:putative ABC transport system permease protein
LLRHVAAGLRSLFQREQADRDLDEELRVYQEMATEEKIKQGMSRNDALREVRLERGGLEVTKEVVSSARWESLLETLWQDLRFAFRMLRKSAGFTTVAVLTLALGIGANTAIFSVVYTSLLRPLPFPQPRQLVDVWGRIKLPDFNFSHMAISLPDIADMRSQNDVFQEIAPHDYDTMTLTGSGSPKQVDSGEVSAAFFPLLGMKPLYGRIFTSAEMQPGQDREVILSYEFWQKQFGGNRQMLGKSIVLNDQPYTIIGIMPPQQHLAYVTDKLWTPLAPTPKELADRSGGGYCFVVARLLPGVTLGQAQADLDAIAARLAKTYPDTHKFWSFHLASLQTDIVGDATTPLLVLLGAVGFVLLIACANVGNLFLSRGWTRRRELTIRSALGATRGRLVRQLFVESLLIAVVGGACGLLFATWGVHLLRTLLPPDTPRVKDLAIGNAVLWFTLGASLLAGILFGLAPAVLSSREELTSVMKEGSGGAQTGATTRHNFLRQVLMVGEVALALMLVIGATLTLRSFARLSRVHLGFRSDHLLTMTINFPPGKYVKPEDSNLYMRQIVLLTRGISDVESAGASLYAPLSGVGRMAPVDDQPVPPHARTPVTSCDLATPGYFQTLGIPLIAGRDFTDADNVNASRVYIVDQAFAQKFFGKQNPIGKRIWSGRKKNAQWGEIVGEVGNFRDHSTQKAPEPEFFAPFGQATEETEGISLVVRTQSDPLAALSAIEDRIWSINKEQPVEDVESMEQLVSASNAQPRFLTFLLGVFGALGLLIALVGIYGVISYSVTQRTHEIGIRMALGAEPRQVMRLILARGLKLALIGVAIGFAASLALTRLMSSLLFGVSATDPVTFAGITILLVAVSLAACYIPARRAMQVDPMVALRYE